MSGSGEKDSFYIYEKVDFNKFLTDESKTRAFLRRTELHEILHDTVIENYFRTKENGPDVRNNYSSSEELKEYYNQLAKEENLEETASKRSCQIEKGPINYSDKRRRKKTVSSIGLMMIRMSDVVITRR